jgi:toxin-antitoxin system PIN domain toxin
VLLPDVNVLVYAFRSDLEQHAAHRDWLAVALDGDEVVGVSELVMSSFLRLVTNHRIFTIPSRLSVALRFCEAVLAAPNAAPVRPSDGHWQRFSALCEESGARGNLVPDAYLAALAMENDATLVTSDAGFRRFAGLRLLRPG